MYAIRSYYDREGKNHTDFDKIMKNIGFYQRQGHLTLQQKITLEEKPENGRTIFGCLSSQKFLELNPDFDNSN